MSVALPAPAPRYLVGVLTAIRTTSASLMHLETCVEKNRLGCRAGSEMVASLWSPHALSHSDDEVEASEAASRLSAFPESLMKEHLREPSRAMRTMSRKPGS